MKTILSNCSALLREGKNYYILDNANIGITDDKISYVGQAAPAEAYDIVEDFSGKLILPGLYNCHTHSPMVLFRGLGNDLPLDKWLFESIFPLEKKLTAKAVEIAARVAIMEMLACGTVSFTDMYFFPEAIAKAVEKIGIKANLCKQLQFPDKKQMDASLQFIRAFDGAADGRILTDFAIHSCYACPPESAKAYSEICQAQNGRMHIHLSETQSEYHNCQKEFGCSPTEWFERIQALGSHTTAAHCVILSDSDLNLLRERQVTVAHCPTSNLKLGSGIAPVSAMLKAGIPVTLGTDGAASNNNLNLPEEMHLAALIHKGVNHSPTDVGIDAVLDMVTFNGALAQGRSCCGEIKCDYQADLIAIDLDQPHLQCGGDIKTLLCYAAQASDVYMTMVDGKILYQDGEFTTINREETLAEYQEILQQLLK